MQTMTITSQSGHVVRAEGFIVRVDGQIRRDIHPLRISLRAGPDFGQAELVMGNPLCRHFHELAALPAVGRGVVLSSAQADQAVLEGVISEHHAFAGQEQDELRIQVRHVLGERLGGALWGRYQQNEGQAAFVYYGQCTFNDEAAGLASDSTFSLGRGQSRIFAPPGKGRLWSVADILCYLLICHAPSSVPLPDLSELAALAGDIYPPSLPLTGLSLGEALAKVAQHAGLILTGRTGGLGGQPDSYICFQRTGAGRRRSVCLQMPGQKLSLAGSNLWKARIALHRRTGQAGVLLLGAPRRYESTFTLQKGWDPAVQSSDYNRFVRSRQNSWDNVAYVFRRWVLNEGGLYDDAPYNLPAWNSSSISEQDFFLRVPRRFEPCLSVDPAGATRGIVVEISTDSGQSFRRYGGPVRIAHDQCAVVLADDTLPSEYFQAALAGTAQVRVTATVAADQRLYYYIPGDADCGVRVLGFPQARWDQVHAASIFVGQPDALQRDDAARLEQIAQTLRRASNSLEAHVSLAWLDCLWQVGDKVQAIDGRGLDLGGPAGQMPLVHAIDHDCQNCLTALTITG